jgi:hypothetical protein
MEKQKQYRQEKWYAGLAEQKYALDVVNFFMEKGDVAGKNSLMSYFRLILHKNNWLFSFALILIVEW